MARVKEEGQGRCRRRREEEGGAHVGAKSGQGRGRRLEATTWAEEGGIAKGRRGGQCPRGKERGGQAMLRRREGGRRAGLCERGEGWVWGFYSVANGGYFTPNFGGGGKCIMGVTGSQGSSLWLAFSFSML